MRNALNDGIYLAESLFRRLAEETADPPGVSRDAYGPGERRAHELVRDEAAGLGLEVTTDPAGNLFATIPGRDRSRRVIMGSHLDSVPHGGNYDGAAGVLAGLAVLAALRSARATPPLDVTVMGIRAEESTWFPYSYIGSKAALGILDPDVLDQVRRNDTGRTLADHMAGEGFDPVSVRRGETWIVPSSVAAYLEMHIEQGPVLEREQVSLGIVTGIRGSFRFRSGRCMGEYAHSGATLRTDRKDAVAATAQLIAALNDDWERWDEEGRDVALTFGILSTNPEAHAFSKVSGEVSFALDVRSLDIPTLKLVERRIKSLATAIEVQRGVSFDLGLRTESAPATMDIGLRQRLEESARTLGVSHRVMASGAGHDAAVFAGAGIPAVMLFVRNAHGSHNPEESMDMTDFAAAVRTMHDFIVGFS